MNKSDIAVMPAYFDRYVNLAPAIDIIDALSQQASLESVLPAALMTDLGDYVYAPGKWTAKDIVQHLIDTERIMAYRALRFARADSTPLPGFEEDDFARSARASRRTITDLYAEFEAVRQATLAMYRSFDDEMLQGTSICAGRDLSVLALGFVLVGHPIHHANVVRERYSR
ncbi:DinB family protein [Fibrella sp. HMF5335]|uniref:DinB family protein n=1 Tax=Fibrella rubiginis TaxID=2817060 RepID=A0A939K6P9_9BACT|nr:DinB family protein [Fibrella rubiginis]MBO0938561.1 DinB family protein [Fibrella rubiginis]